MTRIFGESESLVLPVDRVITLAQSRRSDNLIQPELVASIGEIGLKYPPRIALLGETAFGTYLEFTQREFGETRELDDFETNIFQEGYPTVVDGHSRVEAMRAIDNSEGVTSLVRSIKSEASTPEDVMVEQLAANIHSRPSREEEAPAIAGAFAFALFLNPGMTRSQFAKAHGIQGGHLRDALCFVDLPEQIQDAAGREDGLPFGFAVEIAKRAELLRFYYEVNGSEEVETDVYAELLRYAMLYTNLRSVDKAVARLRSDSKAMKNELFNKGYYDKRPDLFRGLPKRAVELVLFQEDFQRRAYVRAELEELLREHRSIFARRSSRIASLVEEASLFEEAVA